MRIRVLFALFVTLVVMTDVVGTQQRQPARPPAPQPDEPELLDETVKLGTEVVNMMFSAVDRSNRPVIDIRPEEITVLEDGEPQQLFAFSPETSLPIHVAILMDLSGSQEYSFQQQKIAAGSFLRSIVRTGKDAAAILTFQDDVELVQGLATRIELLNRALDEITFSRRIGPASSRRQATAMYDAVYITADEVFGRDSHRPRTADMPTPRRAMILLTDGQDNASFRKLEDCIDRAFRSEVMIYAIGIGDRFRFEGVREDVLRRLAEETGGRAYFPQGPDDLLEDFRRIERELRTQYIVAYSPSNIARDGSFRRVEIVLRGRDDVRLWHRRGYYAQGEEVKK